MPIVAAPIVPVVPSVYVDGILAVEVRTAPFSGIIHKERIGRSRAQVG